MRLSGLFDLSGFSSSLNRTIQSVQHIAWLETYSRDREASQCESPTTVPIDTPTVKRKNGAETIPSPSKRRPGPTVIATMTMKITQARGCAKLMVQPIHGRRRGTITRGSLAHRYTRLQLFGLAHSSSSSLRVTASVLGCAPTGIVPDENCADGLNFHEQLLPGIICVSTREENQMKAIRGGLSV